MNPTNHRTAANNAGELCDIVAGNGIVIEMFRSAKYTGDREGLNGFRPSRVTKTGKTVWDFSTSGAQPGQGAELYDVGDEGKPELVIAVQDRQTIFGVTLVSDFAHSAVALLKGKSVLVGGSSTEQLLDIKLGLASGLDMQYWFNPEEGAILQARTQAKRAADTTARAADEAQKEEARKKRAAAIAAILARPRVEGWDATGKHFFGTPITGDEWKSLKDGAYCIEMKDGQPVRAFIVVKKGNSLKKANEKEITGTQPAKQKAEQPEALDQIPVSLKGQTRNILVFAKMDDIKTLQANGLNSGTWVGHFADDTVAVYEVTAKDIRSVGKLVRQTAEA